VLLEQRLVLEDDAAAREFRLFVHPGNGLSLRGYELLRESEPDHAE
jgi:hypothetical protein